MVKRTLAIIMAVVLLGTMMPLAIAQGTPTITVSSATAQPGETVELKVSISNNPGINAFELGFVFDSSKLELKDVKKGSAEELKDSMVEYTVNPWSYENEDMRTVWFYGTDQDITYNGIYLFLTFEVQSTATEGEAEVEIVLLESEFTNVNEDDITFKANAGGIMVSIPPEGGRIILPEITTTAGMTITANVIIENNPGFSYLKITPVYDSSILELVSMKNGSVSTDAFSANDRSVSWDSEQDAVSDGLLVSIVFKVQDNVEVGSHSLGLIINGCYNNNEDDVTFSVQSGSITIEDFIYGDVNGDGEINGKDIIRLRKYLADYNEETGESTVEITQGADCNGDGTINGKDLIRLRKYLADYNENTGTSTVHLGP